MGAQGRVFDERKERDQSLGTHGEMDQVATPPEREAPDESEMEGLDRPVWLPRWTRRPEVCDTGSHSTWPPSHARPDTIAPWCQQRIAVW